MDDRAPEHREAPFFAYLAFSAPHWPLQCPKEDRDKYKGAYDNGPEALRVRRLARMQRKGLIPEGVDAHEVIASESSKEWSQMTDH